MKVSKAAEVWIGYHEMHSKKNTAPRYKIFIDRFCNEFGNDDINQISSDDVLSFLNRQTEGNKPYTKRIRYAQLSAFFNFIRNNIDHESANPCDTPMIRKLYRERVVSRWKIIEKETVDEIIFRKTKIRNRLILELMARGGMRIGEVLKLKMGDIHDRKLILHEPKRGKQHEIVFIPQKVADRLRETLRKYVRALRTESFQSHMKRPERW